MAVATCALEIEDRITALEKELEGEQNIVAKSKLPTNAELAGKQIVALQAQLAELKQARRGLRMALETIERYHALGSELKEVLGAINED